VDLMNLGAQVANTSTQELVGKKIGKD